MTKLTPEELIEIRKRVETERKQPFRTWATSQLIEGDVPALLLEINRLRNNIKTVEAMTSCEDTRNFAKRSLSGDASIEI